MANRLYNYCMSTRYFSRVQPREDVYHLVKKTALVFALDNMENLNEALSQETLNAVTEMIINN